ncbi:MAG: translation initiation factor [Myxococcaceae bacterium]|nr:translation initiation factor [Myxococcaceae bacterium]
MAKKKDVSAPAPAAPFNNPFAALKDRLGELPSALPPPKTSAPAPEPKGPARAVVRYERKGHGGKEVTLVEQLELAEAQRLAWLKELKQALGCGGQVEGATLVLQGDQRERLPKLLEARGVRKISVG